MSPDELLAAIAHHEHRARAAAAIYQREAAKPNLSRERDKLSADYATDVIAFAEMQCKMPGPDELAALEALYLKLDCDATEARTGEAGANLSTESAREIVAPVESDNRSLIETWHLERRLRIWKEALDELAYIEAVRREYDGDANWTTPH